jgi:sugar/nucleoside kinase (ribokinase family)
MPYFRWYSLCAALVTTAAVFDAALLTGPREVRAPSMKMKEVRRYDIIFVGHIAAGEILPFQGEVEYAHGGASFFGALAAAPLGKRLLVITRMAQTDYSCLESLRSAGIDVHVQPAGETSKMRVIYPTADVDRRELFLIKSAGLFRVEEMPPVKPCLVHLGALSDQEFTLDFIEALKRRGFRLSVDMQSFVWQVDPASRAIHYRDVPEKRDILRMVDCVKLDVNEARWLTGTDDLPAAAETLDGWGSRETVITCAHGVLVRHGGKNYFERFCNRSAQGRTGRGDTLIGAYLARRLDCSVQESLRFAAILTSIKMEAKGPFRGTLAGVLERDIA